MATTSPYLRSMDGKSSPVQMSKLPTSLVEEKPPSHSQSQSPSLLSVQSAELLSAEEGRSLLQSPESTSVAAAVAAAEEQEREREGERIGLLRGETSSTNAEALEDSTNAKSSSFGFFIALSYATLSIAITFLNKTILAVYAFHHTNVLFMGQLILSTSVLVVAKKLSLIHVLDRWRWDHALRCVRLSIAFYSMVFTGLLALAYVSVTTYATIRKSSTVCVIVLQYFLLNRRERTPVVLAVLVMLCGGLLAGWGDLHGSAFGFLMLAGTCVTTACYSVLSLMCMQECKLNVFGLMYYNSLLSLPMVFSYCILSGELVAVWGERERWMAEPGFAVAFVMSGVLAFFMNYSIFLCTRVNSPLTTTVTSDVKNMLTELSGILFFPEDVTLTPFYVSGLAMSFLGGVSYSAIKYFYSEDQRKRLELNPQKLLHSSGSPGIKGDVDAPDGIPTGNNKFGSGKAPIQSAGNNIGVVGGQNTAKTGQNIACVETNSSASKKGDSSEDSGIVASKERGASHRSTSTNQKEMD